MPTTALRRLRRYQDLLLLGGGCVITLVGFLTFAVTCVYAVRHYVAGERQQIMEDRARVEMVVREAETSLRRTVSYIELSWPTLPAADVESYDALVRNGNWLIIPRPTMPSGIIFAAASQAFENPDLVRRYLALAKYFAISNAAASMGNHVEVDGYIYSPHKELIVVPASTLPLNGTPRVSELIELLKVDFSSLAPHAPYRPEGVRQPLHWLPPFTDPLSGNGRLRLVAQAFNNSEPFAVVALEYDPQILLSALAGQANDNTYEIAGPNGEIIAGLGDDTDKRLAGAAAARRELSHPRFFGGEVGYGGGYFVLREPIADTGWNLLYTFSWRDVAAGISTQLGTAAAATAAILGAVWALLLMFRRRVFAPVLTDSARVFESENLSRTVIHTVPVGLALVSRENGEWLLSSPRMKEMGARIEGEEKELADALVARYAEFERENLHGGEHSGVLQQDFVFQAHDGSRVELAVGASPGRFKGVDVLVASFSDVTENRRLQRNLSEAMLAADSANHAKSAFLAAMSHEIRTPLNAILGNLELLSNSPMSSVQRDRLATVRTASDGLLAVISDILDFSKIEAGEMSLEHIEFGVLEVIERVLDIFEPVARVRGIDLYASFDLAVTQTMWGDPTRVGQILNNLLSNAIKFTEHGTVTLIAKIEHTEPTAPQLCLTVADTGIGISPEHRDRLFRAFSQVDVSINRRFGGTGLGLTLCQRLVHAMHGRIDVTSVLHAGSCFTVYLPLGAHSAPRIDAPMIEGRRVLFLSSAQEWFDFVIPHMERWGARVTLFRHPAAITDDDLEDADVLLIWGSREQWLPGDENRVVEEAPLVIDGYPGGPAHAIRTGRVVSVSCLSLTGLEAGVRATLLGESLPGSMEQESPLAQPDQAPSTRSLKVLVAEDNAANRLLLCEQLTSLGCEVKAASNGQHALELFGDDEWDVLLTDLNMPGMSGYQLAEAVRKLRPALPVMVITANATKEEYQRCMAAGLAQVMIKPLSLQQLRDAMSTVASAKGLSLNTFTNADEAKFHGNAMPRQLRDTFLKSTADALAAVEQAEAAQEMDALVAQLHSIRGALVVFGHAALAGDCARVEALINEDRSKPPPAELAPLKTALRELFEQSV
jgi:two-component system, NarL family, capsular synthesis sensor histidine kinase RcsC